MEAQHKKDCLKETVGIPRLACDMALDKYKIFYGVFFIKYDLYLEWSWQLYPISCKCDMKLQTSQHDVFDNWLNKTFPSLTID